MHGPLVLRDGLLEDLGPLGGVWHSVGVNPDDGALLDVVPALAGWVLHHNLHVVPVHRSLPALHHGRLVALQEIALRVEERLGGLEVVLTVDAVDDWLAATKEKMKGQKRVGEEWPIEGRNPNCCNQLTADLAVHIAGPAIELLDEAQVRWLLRGTHHPLGHLGPRLDTGDAVRHDLWCRASEVVGIDGDRWIDVMESVDRDRDHERREQLVWFADWGSVRRMGGRQNLPA